MLSFLPPLKDLEKDEPSFSALLSLRDLLEGPWGFNGTWSILTLQIKELFIVLLYFFADEFENVIKKTTFFNKIKFNFDTEFVKTYFGSDKKAHVRFDDFSHLLQVCDISFFFFFLKLNFCVRAFLLCLIWGRLAPLGLWINWSEFEPWDYCAVFLRKNLVIHFLHKTIYVLFQGVPSLSQNYTGKQCRFGITIIFND